MKTLCLIRVRLAVHAADSRPTRPLSGRMGPGLGSTKTPFGVVVVGTTGGTPDDTLYFHTSTGQPALQSPATPMGPGPWSRKSSCGSRYASGSFRHAEVSGTRFRCAMMWPHGAAKG